MKQTLCFHPITGLKTEDEKFTVIVRGLLECVILMPLLCFLGSVVTILSCSLTEEGHPIVSLSTGKAYMFSADLGSW
jgi:hypothetical protein